MVVMSMPSKVAAFVVTWALISSRSSVFVKSIFLSASEAFGSLALAAFVFTTSTTDFSAAEKASSAFAPAPSAADAKELIAAVICLLTFATFKALATATGSFASTSNGLKVSGSTPSGSPKTAATSSLVKPPSFINVDVGEITSEPEGAFKVIPENVAPEEVSIVLSSAIAIKS